MRKQNNDDDHGGIAQGTIHGTCTQYVQ
jgi:hypothetical protein